MGPDGDMDGPAGPGVTGLEDTLKVELVAGDQKKTFAFSPGEAEGSYTAAFYPTVATTLQYHLVGTIEDHPVDLTYTCIPAGSTKAEMNTTKKDLGNGVIQIMDGGNFTCPVAKEEVGFPEASASITSVAGDAKSAKDFAMVGIALGAVAIVMAGYLARRKQQG
jgi:hypothetical protein